MVTRLKMQDEDYPSLLIVWELNPMGYDGRVQVWKTSDEVECEHKIFISKGSPLAHIFISFDDVGYGCWAHDMFSGATLDERDLQWATLWAKQCVKAKHNIFPCKARRGRE